MSYLSQSSSWWPHSDQDKIPLVFSVSKCNIYSTNTSHRDTLLILLFGLKSLMQWSLLQKHSITHLYPNSKKCFKRQRSCYIPPHYWYILIHKLIEVIIPNPIGGLGGEATGRTPPLRSPPWEVTSECGHHDLC